MKNRSRLTGVILLIIGLILIFWPMSTLNGLCFLIGWCLIGGGIAELLVGFLGESRDAPNIIGGVIAVIIGIIFIVRPGFVITFLPRLIGIVTAAAGIVFLIQALAKKEKGAVEIAQAAGGAVALVVGIILIFYAADTVKLLMIVLGIFVAYFGIMRIAGKRK